MLRRVDTEEPLAERALLGARAPRGAEPPTPPIRAEPETELLPHGHPKWVQDGVSVSQRGRDLVVRLKPAAMRILRFWDHGLRSVVIGGRHVCVDASGSYSAD